MSVIQMKRLHPQVGDKQINKNVIDVISLQLLQQL
jgi:hypothetical protein